MIVKKLIFALAFFLFSSILIIGMIDYDSTLYCAFETPLNELDLRSLYNCKVKFNK